MSCIKSLFLLAFVLSVFAPQVARADVFVWQNPDKNVSISFPDRWGIVSNHEPDEVLRIAAPVKLGEVENPQCRVRVNDDHRFKSYSVAHWDHIQRAAFSRDFWNDYALGFKVAQVNSVSDGGGLGRGFASYADITFDSHEHPRMIRRGFAFVSLYNNQVHVVECSVERDSYERWRPTFMSIVKSVDFDPVSMPFKRGEYRDFYAEQSVIKGVRPAGDYIF